MELSAIGSQDRAGVGTVAGDAAGAALYINSGATVTATGGSRGAGIGGGAGAAPLTTISIGNATVTATGGTGAAGIGGGYANPSGSTVDISSTPTATITATGGAGASGIGGGMADPSTGGGVGADLTVTDGDVTVADGGLTPGAAAGTTAPSAIGGGQDAAVSAFGGFINTASGASGERDVVRIADGARLAVPSGRSITNAGTLVVRGTLAGAGTIDNTGGTIRQEGAGVLDDAALTVTGRNFAVAFDPAGGTTTAPTTKHVYAPSFAAAGQRLADHTGTSAGGRRLFGWTGSRQDPSSSAAPVVQPIGDSDLLAEFASPAGAQVGSVPLTAVYERPIAFTTTALPNAATDQQYAVAAPVTGDATAYDVAADPSTTLPTGTIPTLPTGLALDAATGVVSGRPTTPGHHSFVVTATSRYQSRSQALTIDVAGAPVIATTALPDATTGTGYRAPIVATSDSGPITFALVGGSLPAGLHLDAASGVLAGSPVTSGTFPFTVRASNAFGAVEQVLVLVVAAAAPAPTAPPVGGSATGGAAGTGGAPGSDSGSGAAPAPGAGAGTGTGTGGVTAPPAVVTRPTLPRIPAITVKLGRPLSLAVAAGSTGAVAYSITPKALPKGLRFDPRRALVHGAPLVSGRFVLRVTATNSAGSATRSYTVVVPAATRLVTGSSSAITPRAGGRVDVTVRGLLAGERWRIAVDGRSALRGVSRFGGSITRAVAVPAGRRDRAHVIRVSGDRRVTDPSVLTAHELRITAVVPEKRLSLRRSGTTLTVRGLAAKERVSLRRGRTLLASGRADEHGVFTVRRAALRSGGHTATGSSKQRVGRLVVR